MRPLNIGIDKATEKIKYYCGYQERCHAEVKEKLYSFGLRSHEVETLMALVIEEGYLNEERFAIAFAGGKFRMKQWGKEKIKNELFKKRVTGYCLKIALAEIDAQDYQRTFEKLAKAKWTSLKGERNIYVKKGKTKNYLIQKGYEISLIMNWLAEK